jgi:hypothetical protein
VMLPMKMWASVKRSSTSVSSGFFVSKTGRL